jgi:hypothetical protein
MPVDAAAAPEPGASRASRRVRWSTRPCETANQSNSDELLRAEIRVPPTDTGYGTIPSRDNASVSGGTLRTVATPRATSWPCWPELSEVDFAGSRPAPLHTARWTCGWTQLQASERFAAVATTCLSSAVSSSETALESQRPRCRGALAECRRRDSNPRHADHDSRLIWLDHREILGLLDPALDTSGPSRAQRSPCLHTSRVGPACPTRELRLTDWPGYSPRASGAHALAWRHGGVGAGWDGVRLRCVCC